MSATIVQRIALVLEYPVVFTRAAFALDNRVVVDTLARREPERRHRVVAVVDAGVAAAWPALIAEVEGYVRHHHAHLELLAAPWVVPGGEGAKQAAVLDDLHRRFAALHVDRHCHVIAIGGGAMLDVVGYAAATFHRGVRLVRMPSTVLAQNDAGVGVKNGINAFGAKNLLGTFAAPFAVIADSALLTTLDPRDRAAGMAEAVKVALVRDPAFFGWLVAHAAELRAFEREAVEHMIRTCAALHLAHIAGGGDPFEQGNARPLDYGHWAAHKLELLTDHALRHGEAVAIGIALDSRYAVEAGLLAPADFATIVNLLGDLGLPVWHARLRDPALQAGLAEFREHLGGRLCITLLAGIGAPVEVHAIEPTLLDAAIARLEPAVTAA